MQLQHTSLSFILTTGLSKTQVFEAITCQLVGGQGKFPSPRAAQELKKSTKRALQNEKLQSSGALCLSLNYEAETTAAHRLSFFFFCILLHKRDPARSPCFVLQPEQTSQREPAALGSHLHQ